MPRADPAVVQYGAAVLLRQVNALTAEIEGVRQAKDPEYVHRMRVSSRRLRASLPLFAPLVAPRQADAWLREIRKVTRALGKARDADVQIEQVREFLSTQPPVLRPGLRRLLLRLRQQRATHQPDVLQALDHFQSSAVAERMTERLVPDSSIPFEASKALYTLAWQSTRDKLAALLTYEPYIHDPEKIEELHAMRIAAKRLRYTLEIFAPLYPDELKKPIGQVKDIQTLLGNLHDCDVWLAFLPDFYEVEQRRTLRYFGHLRPFRRLSPGLQAFQDDRCQVRGQVYQRFIRQWDEWQEKRAWHRLVEMLQIPCSPAGAPADLLEVDENRRPDR